MAKHNIPHLLNENPINLYPSLAKALGNVNKAIVLQQVHFLLNMAKLTRNKYVEVDGKWWVYNSYKQWQENHFTWLAERTIKALFNALEKDGIIISRQGVKDAFDRRKWYTIDYDVYLTYVSSIGQKMSDVHRAKNVPSEGQEKSDDIRKSETPNSENENQRKSAPFSTSKKTVTPFIAMKNAIAAAFGWDNPTDEEWGKIQKAAKSLISADVLPDDIASLYLYCKGKLTDFGPTALPNHVSNWRKTKSIANSTVQPVFDLSDWYIPELEPLK